MATATIYGGTADGSLARQAATWAGIASATPTVNTDNTSDGLLRAKFSASNWVLVRIGLVFDVSPYAGATITAATLSLYLADGSAPLQSDLYYYDWGAALEAGDWVSTGSMVLAATSTPGGLGWQTWTLGDLSNLLAKNGRLILALHDESTDPTGINYLQYVLADSASNKPKLDITYEEGGGGLSIPVAMHHYNALRG
jgi:hypothetical protein